MLTADTERPDKLTVKQLQEILTHHNVPFPKRQKKAVYLALFDQQVRGINIYAAR